MRDDSSIIDFHIHLGLPEQANPWVIEWMQANYGGEMESALGQVFTPARLRRYFQDHGLDWVVGLAEMSPMTTGTVSNDYVGQFCAESNALPNPSSGPRGRLLPFASLNPYLISDMAAELERLVKEFDFRGIKVYPPYHHHYANDARMYPLYAKAEELGLPMMVHTGSSVFKGARIKYANPLDLDDVAIDFPDLDILMAHSGRPFWYEQAFWMARRHENVYMEVSGLPAKNLLTYFPRLELLANKVVYGSDWPGIPDLSRNVKAIQALPISDQAKRAILHDNAQKILGLNEESSE